MAVSNPNQSVLLQTNVIPMLVISNLTCLRTVKSIFLHWGDVLVHPDCMLMQSIAIRETSDGQIIIAGAQDVPAESHQEAIRLLEIGSLSRATGKLRVRSVHPPFTTLVDEHTELNRTEQGVVGPIWWLRRCQCDLQLSLRLTAVSVTYSCHCD